MTGPAAHGSRDAVLDQLSTRLAEVLAARFATWPTWRGGWPGQADAALVDAVFSTRSNYDTTVLPLVRRWIAARDARPELGVGVSALTTAGKDALTKAVRNGQCVPGRGRKLKVDAVLEIAACLQKQHLDTAEQIVAAAYQDRGRVRNIVERTPGVGPAQSAYFLMLLGLEGVKADTLVTDWVSTALQVPSLSPADTERVVAGAAAHPSINKPQIVVDHAIWRTESLARRTRRWGSRSARKA